MISTRSARVAPEEARSRRALSTVSLYEHYESANVSQDPAGKALVWSRLGWVAEDAVVPPPVPWRPVEDTKCDEEDQETRGEIPRRRRGKKTPADLDDAFDSVQDDGALARLVHPKWQSRLELPDPREHLFQRARARRIRHEFRLALAGARARQTNPLTAKPRVRSLPAFNPQTMLAPAALERWTKEREQDEIIASALRCWYRVQEPDDFHADANKSYDTGHARHVGVCRADRLLARRLARQRVEAIVEQRADAVYAMIKGYRLGFAYLRSLPGDGDPPQRVAVTLIEAVGPQARAARRKTRDWIGKRRIPGDQVATFEQDFRVGWVPETRAARDQNTAEMHRFNVARVLHDATATLGNSPYSWDEISSCPAWEESVPALPSRIDAERFNRICRKPRQDDESRQGVYSPQIPDRSLRHENRADPEHPE